MTNQEKIKNYIREYPDCLEKVFRYQEVYEIADKILKATVGGKYYSVLRFYSSIAPLLMSQNRLYLFLDPVIPGNSKNWIVLKENGNLLLLRVPKEISKQ